MLTVAFKPGHDGGVAAIRDGRLLFSLEAEKDSFLRYSPMTPVTLLDVAEWLDELPDVVAVGGWNSKVEAGSKALAVRGAFGAGYFGTDRYDVADRQFFGRQVRYFSSSHERSHVFNALGMAPEDDGDVRAVLVWEGILGGFYLVDRHQRITRVVPALTQPGARFAALFAICDPTFPEVGGFVRLGDSGKLMALAAFGDGDAPDPHVDALVERILDAPTMFPVPKSEFQDSPLYNSGVRSDAATHAAARLTRAIFRRYAEVALAELPPGLPLAISGGCGLNCDWNADWRELGHFRSVFVPPCPNDSGSALGTAIDAVATLTGEAHVEWDVYAGLPFVHDTAPHPARWRSRPRDDDAVAARLAEGTVVAWVQGRWEIGPRALGNRSLLAEATDPASRDRLNEIKQREDYRPIAPCVRTEDLAAAFEGDFEDPYMLYFRKVRDPRLGAVTHVDGSARAQTVSATSNPEQHRLLDAVARRSGLGVLCNTSLNFNGHGFINRMSHLTSYCEDRGITDFVVEDTWWQRIDT